MLAVLLTLATLGPVPPLGARAEFLSAGLAVQEALEAGRFQEARERIRSLLPSTTVEYRWTLEGDAAQRAAAFGVARERAFQQWREALDNLSTTASQRPRIAFHVRLATKPGVQLRWSTDPSEPRLTAVLFGSHPDDVRNGVLYALGAWLGLEDSLFPDQAMWPSSKAGGPVHPVTRREASLARELLRHASQLDALAAVGRKIQAARPRAVLRVAGSPPAKVVQGDEASVPLILVNSGNAPLLFRTTSTCGCMASVPSGSVAPGATLRLDAILDTTEYQGQVQKSLWLLTNSADLQRVEVPVATYAEPRYEVSAPPMPVDAESADRSVRLILETPESSPLAILSADLEGIDGTVSVGQTLRSDGRMRTPIEVRFAPLAQDGRVSANVRIATDDARFATLRLPFSVQRGLAALPGTVVMPFEDGVPRPATVTVASSGRPFRVLGVDSPTPELDGQAESDAPAAEHRIRLQWTGEPPKETRTVVVRVRSDWNDRTATLVVQVPGSSR